MKGRVSESESESEVTSAREKVLFMVCGAKSL